METPLSKEGVPKWIEKLGNALVRLFKDPEETEGMKPLHFLNNEVCTTMWDTKESYVNKYHQKSKEGEKHVGRRSQPQGSRQIKSTT